MKQYAWPISVTLTALIAGGGGYFAGSLSERVEGMAKMTESAIAQADDRAAAKANEARLAEVIAERDALKAASAYAPTAPQQPYAAAPAIASDEPPTGLTGLTADGVPVQAKAVLDNPELAGRLIEAMSKTQSVKTAGKAGQDGKPVFVFFDPRCPYCHKAAQELLGQVPVVWIPTTLLGDTDNGVKLVEAMKGATDPAQAIKDMSTSALKPVEASVETREAVNENAGVLYSIFAGAENSIAVPTILVPKPDGTIALMRGFGDGDGAKVTAAYGG